VVERRLDSGSGGRMRSAHIFVCCVPNFVIFNGKCVCVYVYVCVCICLFLSSFVCNCVCVCVLASFIDKYNKTKNFLVHFIFVCVCVCLFVVYMYVMLWLM